MEIKQKYRVYRTQRYNDGSDVIKTIKTFLGETWAASEKKAISNVRYRRYGRVSTNTSDYMGGDASLTSGYVAERA